MSAGASASERNRDWPVFGVDVAFGLVAVVSVVVFLLAGRGTWFFADEWSMAAQVRSPSGLLRPYNNHLSVLILGLYRVLYEVFGFETYLPFRVAGVLSFASVAVAGYTVFRREVGPVAAVAVGVLLLWPRGITLEPGGLNHSLAALGAVVCAFGLNGRGCRRDLAAGLGLAFALAAAGGGVAVAAAAIAHSVLSRAGRSRWAAVLVPTLMWGAWYLAAGPEETEAIAAARPDLAEIVKIAAEHAAWSFSSVTLGNRFGGVLVVALVLAVLVVRLRRGVVAAAGTIAWLVGLGVWWLGLAWSRWLLLDVPTFRYDFTSMVLILVALLPPVGVAREVAGREERIEELRDRARRVLARPWTAPVVLVVLLIALVPTVHGDLQRWSDQFGGYGKHAEATVQVVGFGPVAVADDEKLSFSLGARTGAQMRSIVAAYGAPDGYGDLADHVDRAVTSAAPAAATTTCDRSAPTELDSPPTGRVVVVAPEGGDVEVSASRFGRPPEPVAAVPAGRSVTVSTVGVGSTAPWTFTATGGCLTAG